MPLNCYTIGNIRDHAIITFNDLIFVFKAHTTVDLLNSNGEGELWCALLGYLTSQEVHVSTIQEILVFVFPETDFSGLDVTFYHSETCISAYLFQILKVPCQEVAIKLLEKLFKFMMKTDDIEFWIVCLHLFDCSCTIALGKN
jgi:hypothetical protein